MRSDRCGFGTSIVRTTSTMRAPLLLTLVLALPFVSAVAQTTVTPGSFGFSNGVHPTFDFIFEGTDVKYVESYWRDELKKISHEVSNKKEVTGAGALMPQVSPDTVRVQVKAEQRKGSPLLTAHVAIFTTAGYIGPNSDAKVYAAATAFVQQHSTALRRQLAQQELTEAEKGLARLRNDLANLQREKERAESSIEKSKQRGAEAVVDQDRAKVELDDLTKRIDAQRNEVASAPSEEGTKELNALLKEQTRTLEKSRKAMELEHDMKKKVEDLTFAIKKNVEDQGRKQDEIARQEVLVNTLREKLAAIY
jgi:hypothetical protein